MSTKSLTGYIDYRLSKGLRLLSVSEIKAITDYDEWLDTRSPTTRAAVQSEQKCPSCDGKGELHDLYSSRVVVCKLCKGTGISNRSADG